MTKGVLPGEAFDLFSGGTIEDPAKAERVLAEAEEAREAEALHRMAIHSMEYMDYREPYREKPFYPRVTYAPPSHTIAYKFLEDSIVLGDYVGDSADAFLSRLAYTRFANDAVWRQIINTGHCEVHFSHADQPRVLIYSDYAHPGSLKIKNYIADFYRDSQGILRCNIERKS